MEPQKTQKYFWIVIVLIFVVVGVLFLGNAFSAKKSPNPNENSSGSLSSLQTTDAPWPAEIDHLKDRLTAIGLPALSEEGTTLHIHQHLDIFIHGKPTLVPAGIGINEGDRFISPI